MIDQPTLATGSSVPPRKRIGIGLVLNTYSLLLAVLPILVVIIIGSNLYGQQARDQSMNQMTSLAELKTREIRSWLESSRTTMRLILSDQEQYDRMVRLVGQAGGTGATANNVRAFLEEQLSIQDTFDEIYFYDLQGVVRVSTDLANEGINLNEQTQPYVEPSFEAYSGLLDAGRTRITPRIQAAYRNPATDETNIIVHHPLIDNNGNVLGALAGRLSLARFSEIMETREGLGETGQTYLVAQSTGGLITPATNADASTVESFGIQQALAEENGQGFYANYTNADVIGVYRWIPEIGSAMLAEINEGEALATVREVRDISLLAAALAGLLAIVIGRGVTVWITRPINKLTGVAQNVLKGDFTQRANLKVISEIGQLGHAFDTMTSNLTQTINERDVRLRQIEELSETLEMRVADRTRDLEIAANVARQLTRVLDIDELLQKVVTLTLLSYDLYVCMIYRLDDDGKTLVRAAGVDYNGEDVNLGDMDTISITSERGVVARAAREGQIVVINDVRNSDIYEPHPALPVTRSEITIPLRLGDRLLGIFDLQASHIHRFGEDEITVLSTLAEQISVAMRNAQLFTEAREARAEAEQANQVKSQFLASMSHELRTPLNAILNFTEFVADGVLGDVNEQQVDALTKAIDSGEHLLSLINDVLDLTKIEVGMMELFIEDVNFNSIIDSVMATARGLVKDKPGVELVSQIESDLPQFPGDKRRLRQVLLNLISNAVKFTPEGKVTVNAHRENGGILLTISDTGIGIAEDERAMVFERFRQTGKGSSVGTGTGLGMPITKHLVEAHHGQIWLESVVDEGTTFYVRLPVETTETPPEVEAPPR